MILAALCSISRVHGAFTIKRNRQDCMFPPIAANSERLWPTSAYLPRSTYNTLDIIAGGGFLVSFRPSGRRTPEVPPRSLLNTLPLPQLHPPPNRAGGQRSRLQHRVLRHLQGEISHLQAPAAGSEGRQPQFVGAASSVVTTAAGVTSPPPAVARSRKHPAATPADSCHILTTGSVAADHNKQAGERKVPHVSVWLVAAASAWHDQGVCWPPDVSISR